MPPTIGPSVIGSRGPVPRGEPPEARREQEEQINEIGVVAKPASSGRVAGDLLEEEADEEEAADQAGVGDQRGPGWRRRSCGSGTATRSSIGCRSRASQTRKAAKQTIPPISGTQTSGLAQPWVGCSISANTGPPSPRAESPIPAQSMPRQAPGPGSRAPQRRVSATVTTISGTLTQKIARQESASTSAPPPAGPNTVAIPVQAVQVPIALPALGALEGGGDDRQRAGDEQRSGHPLEGAGGDQEARPTARRAEAIEVTPKPISPTTNIRLPPELVAERAADQEQRDHRQQVGLDDPLLIGEAGVEVRR